MYIYILLLCTSSQGLFLGGSLSGNHTILQCIPAATGPCRIHVMGTSGRRLPKEIMNAIVFHQGMSHRK